MSNHLSQDQLSRWIAGEASPEQERHGRECPECRAELARFQEPVSAFKMAMQDWSGRERPPGISDVVGRRRGFSASWRWAAVSMAVVILAAIPIYRRESELRRQARAEEAIRVMGDVNVHISRTIPEPMERVMALIPEDLSTTETGITQGAIQ